MYSSCNFSTRLWTIVGCTCRSTSHQSYPVTIQYSRRNNRWRNVVFISSTWPIEGDTLSMCSCRKKKQPTKNYKKTPTRCHRELYPYFAVVVNSCQCKWCPRELKCLEVNRRSSCSLSFNCRLISRPLPRAWRRGGAIKHSHCVKRQAMENLNTAVMKGKSQT